MSRRRGASQRRRRSAASPWRRRRAAPRRKHNTRRTTDWDPVTPPFVPQAQQRAVRGRAARGLRGTPRACFAKATAVHTTWSATSVALAAVRWRIPRWETTSCAITPLIFACRSQARKDRRTRQKCAWQQGPRSRRQPSLVARLAERSRGLRAPLASSETTRRCQCSDPGPSVPSRARTSRR